MKRKLLLYAVISTPIFAIYAVSHPLIFGMLPLKVLLVPLLGININVFITWLINIYLTLNFSHLSIEKKIFLSYVSILVIQLILNGVRFFFLTGRNVFVPDEAIGFVENNMIYPALTTTVINVIIIIICQATEASYRRNEAELKAKELELENSEAQRKLLVQQLQPHFLFNAMSVLKSLIQENPEAAEDYTVRLSEFLRYSVESQKKELVSLAKELQFVNDYVELQKVRFDDSFSYEVSVSEADMQLQVPIFALQTLVENAFKHNHFTKQNPLIVKVFSKESNLIIWNNKKLAKSTQQTHTGLANLQRRYDLIAARSINIENLDHSFSVTIPLLGEYDL
jgi:two-component system, LytTR family, sensor kinase